MKGLHIMMREITEEQACDLAGDAECPLLAKLEHDATESAVAFKQFPTGFLVGISTDTQDRFQFFFGDDEAEARALYERHAARMRETGTPFFD